MTDEEKRAWADRASKVMSQVVDNPEGVGTRLAAMIQSLPAEFHPSMIRVTLDGEELAAARSEKRQASMATDTAFSRLEETGRAMGYGTQAALADALGVEKSRVKSWKKLGFAPLLMFEKLGRAPDLHAEHLIREQERHSRLRKAQIEQLAALKATGLHQLGLAQDHPGLSHVPSHGPFPMARQRMGSGAMKRKFVRTFLQEKADLFVMLFDDVCQEVDDQFKTRAHGNADFAVQMVSQRHKLALQEAFTPLMAELYRLRNPDRAKFLSRAGVPAAVVEDVTIFQRAKELALGQPRPVAQAAE